MKKSIIIGLALLGFCSTVNAQVEGGDEKFQKLFDLYVMEKFEDCAYKAEKFTLDDRTRKAPEPYLYLSMCYFEIYNNIEEYDQELYGKALYDAMKYASKFRKKDKEGTIFEQNTDYFEDLTKATIKEARSFYYEDNYRKASSVFRKMQKFDPKNEDIRYMTGVCQIMSNNLGEGTKALTTAVPILKKNYNDNSYIPNDQTEEILKEAMILYSGYMAENGDVDSAKRTINLAREFFTGDEDVEEAYAKLNK